MTVLLWLCFALSGAGALALELLWMRSAGLVLGTTAETAATVVAGYFAGLGLGGFLARHAPRAPVRRYGRLELAVAAGGIGSYGVFRLLSTDAAQHALAASPATGGDTQGSPIPPPVAHRRWHWARGNRARDPLDGLLCSGPPQLGLLLRRGEPRVSARDRDRRGALGGAPSLRCADTRRRREPGRRGPRVDHGRLEFRLLDGWPPLLRHGARSSRVYRANRRPRRRDGRAGDRCGGRGPAGPLGGVWRTGERGAPGRRADGGEPCRGRGGGAGRGVRHPALDRPSVGIPGRGRCLRGSGRNRRGPGCVAPARRVRRPPDD